MIDDRKLIGPSKVNVRGLEVGIQTGQRVVDHLPDLAHRLTRLVGRPSQTKVKRFFEDFHYQAASWDKARRVIAKIEWPPGELFPHVGFIVTNLRVEPDWVVPFYKGSDAGGGRIVR